jgi:glycolate oxidase FAD binding subunit
VSRAASSLDAFARDVGPVEAGPVTVVGGRTQGGAGGALAPGTRELRAPAAVVRCDPADLTVRVGAGTTVAELRGALAEHGQTVALPAWPGATVGGVLAVGQSGLRRLGLGPVRDTVLQVRYVSAWGEVVTAGGPTVKNVSGFDLCRVLVGSLGTLGLLAELLLRTRPKPQVSCWLAGPVDPREARRALFAPAALLWDGVTTWALLEGHAGDVDDERQAAAALGLEAVDGPPPLPPHRWSSPAADVFGLTGTFAPGTFVAEVGVGVVHVPEPAPPRKLDPAIEAVSERLRERFDPTGRLNPGRDPRRI